MPDVLQPSPKTLENSLIVLSCTLGRVISPKTFKNISGDPISPSFLVYKQHQYLNPCQQHLELLSSLPTKYYFPSKVHCLTLVFMWELVFSTW